MTPIPPEVTYETVIVTDDNDVTYEYLCDRLVWVADRSGTPVEIPAKDLRPGMLLLVPLLVMTLDHCKVVEHKRPSVSDHTPIRNIPTIVLKDKRMVKSGG